MTGVWVGNEKVAAIGVHISRWVTSHGFALNVHPDLRYFEFIIPCGIRQYGVTSMERLLGTALDMVEVKRAVVRHMEQTFRPAAAPAGPGYTAEPAESAERLPPVR